MSGNGDGLPPARERNRYGLRSYSAGGACAPDATEALFDKVIIRVRGSVHGGGEEAIRDFAAGIGSGGAASSNDVPRLFGRGNWSGGAWKARAVGGNTIMGSVELHQRGASAAIDVELWLNPIRTLEHLLQSYTPAEILEVSPAEFFREVPATKAADQTLDGRDNMVSNFRRFGGTTHAGLVQRVAAYLDRFEDALKARLLHELAPSHRWSEANGHLVGQGGGLEVRLHWGQLTVSQCEVCWERHTPEALPVMRRLAHGVLAAARQAEVRTHPGFRRAAVAREQGSLSVKVPLVPNGKVALVVYAKALDRLRFEVRYLNPISQHIRDRLPDSRRLTDWFGAFSGDATARLPWDALGRLLQPQPSADLTAMLDLIDAVTKATARLPNKRKPLLLELLHQGALTSTSDEGFAPVKVVARLVRAGIVEHVRMMARDHEVGRRVRLAPRYAGVPKLVALMLENEE